MRAMKGATASVSGTTAAAVPIEVPTTRRVKGMIATSRMMKGTERSALITVPSTALKAGIGTKDLRSVMKRTTPRGTPRSAPTPPEMATIARVSRSDCQMMTSMSEDIVEFLHDYAAGADEFDDADVVRDGGFDEHREGAERAAVQVVDRAAKNAQIHVEALRAL